MAKRLEYHIITGDKGFKDLETKVTERLNRGWKTIGGVAFNGGYPYQAMACISDGKEPEPEREDDRNKALGMTTAAGAYKRLEDLT